MENLWRLVEGNCCVDKDGTDGDIIALLMIASTLRRKKQQFVKN